MNLLVFISAAVLVLMDIVMKHFGSSGIETGLLCLIYSYLFLGDK